MCCCRKTYHKRNKCIYALREDATGKRTGTVCAVTRTKRHGRRTTKKYYLLSWNELAQSSAEEVMATRFSNQVSKRKMKYSVKIVNPAREEGLSYFELKVRPDHCLNLVDHNLSQEELKVVQAGFAAYTFMGEDVIQLDFKLNQISGKYDLVNVEPALHKFDEKFAIGAPIIIEHGRTKKDTVIGVLGVSTKGDLIPVFHKDAGVDLTGTLAVREVSPGEQSEAGSSVQLDLTERKGRESPQEETGPAQSGLPSVVELDNLPVASSDRELDQHPSVRELDNLAKEIPECWYSLGIQLGLGTAAVDNILLNNVEHTSPVKKASQMLIEWWKSPAATYRELSEALRRVDRQNLVEKMLSRQGAIQACGRCQDPPLLKEIMNEYERRHSWIHPFPWLDHFQLALKDVFTRLKLIVREKGTYVRSDKTVSMFQIFEPHEHCDNPQRVLIEADPGMGKTTFSEKLCLDWATRENMRPFPLLPLVILLKCRDLLSDNIMEAIVDQLLPKDVSEKDKSALLKYVEENQSDILLVVDGVDELRKEVDLTDLLQRKIMSQIHLLITTRHGAGINIRQYFDSLFEITGYTISDAKAYIRKYFEIIKEEEKGERLLRKVHETFHPNGKAKIKDAAYLKELLSNPLRTSLLCAVCEDCADELPVRRTQLYTDISSCILRRHFKKEFPGAELPREPLLYYREDILILGKLAYLGIEKNQLYFDAKELEDSPHIAKFGFVSKEAAASKTKPILKYSFLHKTFQEYFAAFYLCEELVCRKVKSKKIIEQHSNDIRKFTQVFIFCAGILAGKRASAVLVAFMKSLTRLLVKGKAIVGSVEFSFLLLCDCVCEGIVGGELNDEQKKLCAVIGQEMSWGQLWLDGEVGDEKSRRYKVLCEVMKKNRTVRELDLINNQLTDVRLLVDSLQRKTKTTLEWLFLSENPITDLTGLTELKRRNEWLCIYTDKGEIKLEQ